MATKLEKVIMHFSLNHEYMSESYDQFRKYGSKSLLIERFLGIIFIIFGISFIIYSNETTVLSSILIIIGVFELANNYITKYFWLRRHKKSKLWNADVEILVTQEGIQSTGPFSHGEFNWDGIEKVVRTPKGILVWPQKGIYWYLPERIYGKETIELIESKITA